MERSGFPETTETEIEVLFREWSGADFPKQLKIAYYEQVKPFVVAMPLS